MSGSNEISRQRKGYTFLSKIIWTDEPNALQDERNLSHFRESDAGQQFTRIIGEQIFMSAFREAFRWIPWFGMLFLATAMITVPNVCKLILVVSL
jgi:hypothetical protein